MLRPSQIASLIETEEAAIDRRFNTGPFGLLFHGDDGRGWKVREDQAEVFKSRARSHMLAYVARSSTAELGSIAVGLALAAVVAFVSGKLFGTTSYGLGVAMVTIFAVHPLVPFGRLYFFRREQKAMREEFIRSLGLVSPLPVEAAKPYRHTNIWYPLLYGTVSLMVGAGLAIQHFAGGTFSSMEQSGQAASSGANMAMLTLCILPGLLLAWIFYFLAKAKDRKLRR